MKNVGKSKKRRKSRKSRESRESRERRKTRKTREIRKSVPVTDILEVQVLDGQGDLEEVQLSLGLVQLRLLNNLVKQLPALC